MQFETFRGKDVAEALAQVRAAYGENAIVGSTRFISNGMHGAFSHRIVEVTAAPGDMTVARRIPASSSVNQSTRPSASRLTSYSKAPSAHESALSEEIRNLRALVEEMAASTRRPKDCAINILESLGIEGPSAIEIAKGVSKSSRVSNEALRSALAARVAEVVQVIDSPLEAPGPMVISCVGPAGVGKTTTLAKLAARAYFELGRSVAIITLDTFRVGAVEQMRRFASLLGVPFEVAHDVDTFREFINGCTEDIVFIDTPSRSPSDTVALKRLTDCLAAVTDREAHIFLTVPATLRARDLDRVIKSYSEVRPTALVVTKLDESEAAGGAVCASLRSQLPFAFVCDGPRVPEDVHEVSASDIVNRVFGNG